MHFKHLICLSTALSFSSLAFANPTFLAADQAFQFSAESLSKDKIALNWKIEPHYYLYHDQFKITEQNSKVEFKLPDGIFKEDPTFGRTVVHYDNVKTEIQTKPNTDYKVVWQGCSQDGLCYPLQSKIISTDQDGLLPFEQSSPNPQLKSNDLQSNLTTLSNAPNQAIDLNTTESNQSINEASSLQWNDDLSFFNLLSNDSIFLNLLIFFGLGILLAFLPCSLPLIPIISSLIIQKNRGLKATQIALSFIISMAIVYGLMGYFVAELGYNFQRWLQNPYVLTSFAILFVIFALNLFGLFQISLPQRWINRLNNIQSKQKNGTLWGSLSMGALSALIVGPCMSAPLAGALLFVSQSQSSLMGGIYLFVLGLGIGFPLLIACVFGAKLLPKPGNWMNSLKVLFGFLMLGLAIYFIRPMLGTLGYYIAFSLMSLALTGYFIHLLKYSNKQLTQAMISLLLLGCVLGTFYFGYKAIGYQKIEKNHSSQLNWNYVSRFDDFKRQLQEAKSRNLAVIVDVYADWCVACQPIENEVFTRVDVQNALQPYYLIKLDLSQHNDSQDQLLKEFEILGPPTLLLFDQNGLERRDLRLTGTFNAETLISHLNKKPLN